MYSASRSTGSVRQCSALPGIGRPNKQRQIFDARACLLEHRLEQQVQQEVVAADVEDERD